MLRNFCNCSMAKIVSRILRIRLSQIVCMSLLMSDRKAKFKKRLKMAANWYSKWEPRNHQGGIGQAISNFREFVVN